MVPTLQPRQKKRFLQIALTGLLLSAAAAIIFSALRDQVVFYYTPQELKQKKIGPHQTVRLGGLVVPKSIQYDKDGRTYFTITDTQVAIPVAYKGMLPDLFRDGQGTVAQGYLDATGIFQASTVLAKHDETYMPKEVMDKLKESGHWRESKAP